MKDFLLRLEARSFAGRYGFAFDTRYDSFKVGSAAKYIEKRLETTRHADNQSSYITDSQERVFRSEVFWGHGSVTSS